MKEPKVGKKKVKAFEEFPFLREAMEGSACTDITEALFLTQGNGKEKGIVFETKNGNIALQLSELKQIIKYLER